MTVLRALCAELAEIVASEFGVLREYESGKELLGDFEIEVLRRVRAELDQPQPAPTDEELLRLTREWNSGHESIEFEFIGDYAREVIARWGKA